MKSKIHSLVVIVPLLLGAMNAAAMTTTVPQQALRVVKGALDAWEHEDWTKMYSFLSSRDKENTPFKQFMEKRQRLAIVEKLINYRIKSANMAGNNDVFVRIELVMLKGPDTRVFPSTGWRSKIVTTTWHLVRQTNNDWKITFESHNHQRGDRP